MLSRFLQGKNRVDHPDSAVRLRALESLDDSDSDSAQQILCNAARTDEAEDVRRAAIAKLNSPEVLGELLAVASLCEASAERIARLLPTGSNSELASHPAVIKARVLQAPLIEIAQIVREVTDPSLLTELALTRRGEVREQILQHPAFDTSDVLSELERKSRDRDKSLNRLARERLDIIKQLRGSSEQSATRLDELLQTLTKHTELDSESTGYWPKFETLRNQAAGLLQRLTENHQALLPHAEGVSEITTLQDRFEKFRGVEIAPSNAAEKSGPAIRDPADADPFDLLVAGFTKLEASLTASADFGSLRATRQQLTDDWLAAADQRPPADAQHEVFQRVSHKFRELLDASQRLQSVQLADLDATSLPENLAEEHAEADQLWRQTGQKKKAIRQAKQAVKQISWPQWKTPPDEYVQLVSNIAILESAVRNLEGQASTLLQTVESDVDEFAAAIESGASESARTLLNHIRQQLRRLPRELTVKLNARVNLEDKRLAELRDWQTYATTPKRESLCAAVAELIARPLAPADQAHRIKELRLDWNGLGSISQAKDRRLADKFNRLAAEAFEPCRTHFAAQAVIRESNLQSRKEICAQLSTYLDSTDWQSADMKAAEQILRTARGEWRKFHPVERAPGKTLDVKFEKLQSQLHDLVRSAWEQNLSLKKAIVEEAAALASSDAPIEERVDGAKTLQQRWRKIGITPRRPDQELWRKLRSSCDSVFADRENQQKAADDSRKAAQKTANECLAEIEAAVANEAEPSRESLRQYRHRFKALEKLPAHPQRLIEKQFSEIEAAYKKRLQAHDADKSMQWLDSIEQFDHAVSQQETDHRAGGAITFEAPDILFADRWDQVDAPVPAQELTRLTVEAELAAGLESTQADKNLRLAIQVDAFNLAKGGAVTARGAQTLLEQWCRTGPKDTTIDELRRRFFLAIRTLRLT
ncbi:MAG: DUF349 domain-containing protein [Gammaproteobacteria bacterium]|nr:DUF349 domain-containing protein [Gammaproteobacteria bacterium]